MSVLRTPVGKGDHVQGNPSAMVELVEYGDYQCPYCQRAYPIIKRMQREFGEDLKFVFRNFPLTNMHSQAMQAAIATEAAARQGLYWEMHDYLFEHHEDFSIETLVSYANILGLDAELFKNDMEKMSAELTSKVEADKYGGLRSGVNGTPTFFINGERFNGDWQGNDLLFAIGAIIR